MSNLTSYPPERIYDSLAPCVTDERLRRFDSVLEQRTLALTLVLDNVYHQHNISAVIRSADAFGIHAIHVVGGETRMNSGIALGSERWLNIYRHETADDALRAVKGGGYKTVVLQAPHSSGQYEALTSVPVETLPFAREKLALVFGNEVKGAAEDFFATADYRAYLSMVGFVESFNISVAAALCLYAARHCGRPLPPIDDEERLKTKARWLREDVPGAELILKRMLP